MGAAARKFTEKTGTESDVAIAEWESEKKTDHSSVEA